MNQALKRVRVLKRLPDIFDHRPAYLPRDLSGATIVAIGSPQDTAIVDGGGLIIDYKPLGADHTSRIVLAFDDTAMWVAAHISEV